MSDSNKEMQAATEKYMELLTKGNFDFLSLDNKCERTFLLGFFQGIIYASDIHKEQLKKLHSQLTPELKDIIQNNVVLERYNIS